VFTTQSQYQDLLTVIPTVYVFGHWVFLLTQYTITGLMHLRIFQRHTGCNVARQRIGNPFLFLGQSVDNSFAFQSLCLLRNSAIVSSFYATVNPYGSGSVSQFIHALTQRMFTLVRVISTQDNYLALLPV